jgi:hypothetical protein
MEYREAQSNGFGLTQFKHHYAQWRAPQPDAPNPPGGGGGAGGSPFQIYQQNPARFGNKKPIAPQGPVAVWINPPQQEKEKRNKNELA